jgi:hypothetical protein
MKCFFTALVAVLFQFLGFAQNSSKSKEIIAVVARVENLRQVMINADGEKRKVLTSENFC